MYGLKIWRSLPVDKANKEGAHKLGALREIDMDPDPVIQFRKWYKDAFMSNSIQPDAMTVASATKDGKPSARMMLLKDVDSELFVFYSNQESRKGENFSQNPKAAIVFWWPLFERQVRVEGIIEKISDNEADSYFKTRPRGSRLAAWASNQSRVISSREALDHRFSELKALYKGRDIPRPPYWVGYRLRHSTIEFWQGRPNRLHDRLKYRQVDGEGWIMERLSP
jgi:pyridoxamine 5'-phosphate oxidase